ncbi:MAG: Hsp33 family molecular chaperone HslO [Thermoanaerobacteraceae bacterium]|nr:Hsp33 family molecular chaperone HslO [Thermoanaerobacteraceae bacterium]
MGDHLLRATAQGQIRMLAAVTTDLVNEAQRRHKTLPTATAALGRVLTAAVMMGATLKGEETLTLRVMGDGPLGTLVAVANARGRVKGYVQNPRVHLPLRETDGKLDVGRAVGKNGMLHVAKDLSLKEPYTGSVPLVSGEIGEDLARYYLDSEQTPSAVALGVLVDTDNSVKAAGGYIVQLLPGTDEDIISRLEENIKSAQNVSRLIDGGKDARQLIEEVLKGFAIKIHERLDLQFACDCSFERLEELLVSLGSEEIKSMIEEEQGAEVRCHFCNEEYHFSKTDLERLLREMKE